VYISFIMLCFFPWYSVYMIVYRATLSIIQPSLAVGVSRDTMGSALSQTEGTPSYTASTGSSTNNTASEHPIHVHSPPAQSALQSSPAAAPSPHHTAQLASSGGRGGGDVVDAATVEGDESDDVVFVVRDGTGH
jgi:hypothetical protein